MHSRKYVYSRICNFVKLHHTLLACILLVFFVTYLSRINFVEKPHRNLQPNITAVINDYRRRLQIEFKHFELPDGKPLSSYVPELGGTPLRTVIVTSWRSGSTFLGALLNSIPGSFYFFEPLKDFGDVRIRKGPTSNKAIGKIHQFFNCNYPEIKHHVNFIRHNFTVFFSRNKPLGTICQSYRQFCFNITFLTQFCSLFPLQIMKVLRLSLQFVGKLLAIEE